MQKYIKKYAVYILSLGHMITDINQGVLPIFLAVFKDQYGLTYLSSGFVIFLANFTSSVIQPLFGYLSDRRHLLYLLPSGCLVAGLAMSFFGMANNYILLVTVVFISSLGIAAFHPEASKSTHYVGGRMQSSSMGVFVVGGNFGLAFGPLIAALILSLGGLQYSWILAFPAMVAAILLYQSIPFIRDATALKKQSLALKQDQTQQLCNGHLHAVRILIAVVALRSWLQSGLTFYIPFYYINYLQGDESFTSVLLTIFLLAGAVGTLAGGRLADYCGAKKMIILSMMILIPLVFVLPYFEGILIVPLLALSGLVLFASWAPAIVMIQNLLPNNVGMASGLLSGFAFGAGGIGVVFLGSIADKMGVPFVIHLMALIPVAAAVLSRFLPEMCKDHS